MDYNFKKIEEKWQAIWEKQKTFVTPNFSNKTKYYVLDMFPYPSNTGLHVGHIEGYTASDIVARYKRLCGYNVLHPFGWDAFGLPAEQYALQTGNDPKSFTYKNIANFKKQIIRSGKSIDWTREFATCDENYFKWTQWIFKKLFEHNLAELKDIEVNWCEELGTVLANDEIIIKDGQMTSERGGFLVIKKAMRQWVLKITKYADRLLNDLDILDWPQNLKQMQRNWIGKSTGALINFKIQNINDKIKVFTTRCDTIYGVSYLVLAPENHLVNELTTNEFKNSIASYINKTKSKSDLERQTNKEKTGVFTGSYAVHPLTSKLLPIWISDYVLPNYGTGAVMAVPHHDERDFEFANKYHLNKTKIIECDDNICFTGDGIHINSELINGLDNQAASQKIINYLEETKTGCAHNTYRLRDWIFSRQRYWGEPFPIIFGENDTIYPLDDQDLPLTLPFIDNIKPSGDGQSPLANAVDWVNVKYKGIKGKRDTNTMPQLAGSSWYYIAYCLNFLNNITPLDSTSAKEILDKWLPVDIYIGGTEHAVGHLLYARFWHKFLYDLGLVSCPEPFLKLVNQGMILGSDHQKMSKSKGNGVSPDEIYETHGADSLRLYEMFMGPLESEKPWSTEALDGSKRFLERVVRMFEIAELVDENVAELEFIYHQSVKKVTNDFEALSFNTAISQLMIFVNEVYKIKYINREMALNFLILLNPICPHLTEELNQLVLNNDLVLSNAVWPSYDEKKLIVNTTTYACQINGKLRATINTLINLEQDAVLNLCLNNDNLAKYIKKDSIKKIIFIKNKIINIIV